MTPIRHDWVLVTTFGESETFVDRNSIRKIGEVISVIVMYPLIPPGTDKRNNKNVSKMLNSEQYDLRTGYYRLLQVNFEYVDGDKSEPLYTQPEWRPASDAFEPLKCFSKGLTEQRHDPHGSRGFKGWGETPLAKFRISRLRVRPAVIQTYKLGAMYNLTA